MLSPVAVRQHPGMFVLGMGAACAVYFVLLLAGAGTHGAGAHLQQHGRIPGVARASTDDGGAAARASLRELATRVRAQDEEIARLRAELAAAVAAPAPPPAVPKPLPLSGQAPAPEPQQPPGDDRNGPATLALLPRCSWARPEHYTHAPASPERHSEIWRRLRSKNIMFILAAGSLLGAFRHGGCIPGDGDSDVVFPVWRNLALAGPVCLRALRERAAAGSPDYAAGMLRRLEAGVVGAREAFATNAFYDEFHVDEDKAAGRPEALCGLGRTEWVHETAAWLREQFPGLGMHVTEYGGIRLAGSTDFIVSMKDERFFPPYNDHACRCDWYETEVGCWEQSGRWLERKYGPRYMTPDRR